MHFCITSAIFFIFIPRDGQNVIFKDSNKLHRQLFHQLQDKFKDKIARININKRINPKIQREGNDLSAFLRNAVSNTSSNTTNAQQVLASQVEVPKCTIFKIRIRLFYSDGIVYNFSGIIKYLKDW